MTNLESGQRTSPFLSYCWDDLDMAYIVALQTSCEKFSYNLQKRNGA